VLVIPALAAGALWLVQRGVPTGDRDELEDDDHAHVELNVGATMPDFELRRFGDGKVRFSSLNQKVVLINFWATWCEPCRTEMPSIARLRAAYKDKGFDVMAINIDEDPDSVVPPALKAMALKDLPIYTDQEGRASDIFQVEAVPLTVILNHDRKILLVETGERDWNDKEIRQQLESWLAG
jgi:thiol-disulfide isomerase/thioredoxin